MPNPTRPPPSCRPALALLAAAAVVGCGRGAPDGTRTTEPATGFRLLDAQAAAIPFVHHNGAMGNTAVAEIMGAGVALLDYDNDGDLDVYLVQGGPLGGDDPADPAPAVGDRLFRNELAAAPDGAARLQFTDVTEEAGLVDRDYGMGVATGDIDNDGWVDLFVANLGANRLWRNQGDGTFADVSGQAGVSGGRAWSTGAAFFDFDADGAEDLYVINYVAEDPLRPQTCRAANSTPDYCSPLNYPAVGNRLYRNQGDGRFADVTEGAGMGGVAHPSLGVVTGDFNRDGRPDVFVANDATDNELWINLGDGRFREEGLARGAAVNGNGEPEAGMGVDAGDYDDDGDLDLFLTHLRGETNTLYVNDGAGVFSDLTIEARLGPPSLRYTGFGTGWLDYDSDGELDLFVVNGAVRLYGQPATAGDVSPLAERDQLFRGRGDGTFEEVSEPALAQPGVSRGAAFGDLDNDGDTDIVVTHNDGPVRVLVNEAGGDRHWLGLALRSGQPPRFASGARVVVDLVRADGGRRELLRPASRQGSYLSANDPRVLVGLGDADRVEAVRVYWADGSAERWRGLAVDRYHELVRGSGEALDDDRH